MTHGAVQVIEAITNYYRTIEKLTHFFELIRTNHKSANKLQEIVSLLENLSASSYRCEFIP